MIGLRHGMTHLGRFFELKPQIEHVPVMVTDWIEVLHP